MRERPRTGIARGFRLEKHFCVYHSWSYENVLNGRQAMDMYFSTSEESCECSLVACGVKISQNVGRILKIDSQKLCVRVHGSAVQLSPRMGAFTRNLAGLYPRVTRSLANFTHVEPAGQIATARRLGASAMASFN